MPMRARNNITNFWLGAFREKNKNQFKIFKYLISLWSEYGAKKKMVLVANESKKKFSFVRFGKLSARSL